MLTEVPMSTDQYFTRDCMYSTVYPLTEQTGCLEFALPLLGSFQSTSLHTTRYLCFYFHLLCLPDMLEIDSLSI